MPVYRTRRNTTRCCVRLRDVCEISVLVLTCGYALPTERIARTSELQTYASRAEHVQLLKRRSSHLSVTSSSTKKSLFGFELPVHDLFIPVTLLGVANYLRSHHFEPEAPSCSFFFRASSCFLRILSASRSLRCWCVKPELPSLSPAGRFF